MSCVFCEIIAGRAAASVVHRDSQCIAFMDLNPATPGHVLVVPLAHATGLAELEPRVGGALFAVAQRLAAALRRSGLRADGINFFLADGEAAGQEVFHVHLHVLPRFPADGFGLAMPAGYPRAADRRELDRLATLVTGALDGG
jgi:histidine triad (HIT) family protein